MSTKVKTRGDMADFISRNEFNSCMDRMHSKVDEILKSSIRTEESARHTEKFAKHIDEKVDTLYKVIFGNEEGKDGMVTKIKTLWRSVNMQWVLFSGGIIAFMGGVWKIIVELIKMQGGGC
jgi:predicted transcriptional regulator